MASCHCHMCGRNNAGANNVRKDYLMAGVSFDEDAIWAYPQYMKRQSHRALRRYNRDLIRNARLELGY